jgi:putative colanic acid biosynthesis acetyltransferase WcaF
MLNPMNTDSGKKNNPIVDLANYRITGYVPGAGPLRRGLWYIANALVLSGSLFPFYGPKRALLRLFGAQIGEAVIIKPRVNIKHPWRLTVGDHCWIGEGVWIDNLVEITIGNNVCISQEAYLLTGNHNYKSPAFDLMTKPVRIDDGAWIGARGIVCPGVVVGCNAVLTVGSVLTQNAKTNGIYSGNPAQLVKTRIIEPG